MILHRQSRAFSTSFRTPPKEAQTVNHKLLIQAGFVRQIAAGVFSLLPPGLRVHERIRAIIREEMNRIGAQEILMPTLQPKSLWLETGRWTTIDPPLFTTRDRHKSELALGPTHEEVVTDLARNIIHSYKQLPLAVYQIQTKFRNEQRPSGGLLRLREFCMKDLYSFHTSEKDLISYYENVQKAYHAIFQRCGLGIIPIAAESGTIGGAVSHEFALPSDVGEDTFAQCEACGLAANTERLGKAKTCPECKNKLVFRSCIECGHTFQLGTKYSKQMNAMFANSDGSKAPVHMGCYGIGVDRLFAAAVESSHDKRGIVWHPEIAPYDVHVLLLRGGDNAEEIAKKIAHAGKSVLYDDREDISPGEKFTDAELIGIPIQAIVSERGNAKGNIEIRSRSALDSSQMVSKNDEKEILKAIERAT